MTNTALNIHRETDVLALARAQKKVDYWTKVQSGELPAVDGQDPNERLEYWLEMYTKYKARIEKHISDFNKIKDPLSFLAWISGIVETIKSIINLITR